MKTNVKNANSRNATTLTASPRVASRSITGGLPERLLRACASDPGLTQSQAVLIAVDPVPLAEAWACLYLPLELHSLQHHPPGAAKTHSRSISLALSLRTE